MKHLSICIACIVIVIQSYGLGLSSSSSRIVLPLHNVNYMPASENEVREPMTSKENSFSILDDKYTLELDSAYWLRFEIVNTDNMFGAWVFDFGSLSFASVYLVNIKGTIETKHTGRMLACSQKNNPEIGAEIIRFNLQANERKTVYIYCKAINPTVKLKEIVVYTQPAFEKHIRNMYLKYGAFFGFLALVFVCSLLLAVFLRLQVYLMFALYVLGAGVFVAYVSNFFAIYFFQNWPNQALLFEIFLFVCFIAYSYMIKYFLNTNCATCIFMKAQRIWRIFAICCIVVLTFVAFACEATSLFVLQDILSTANLILATILLLATLKMKNRAMRYFVAGTLITAVGGIILQISKLFVSFEIDGLIICLTLEVLLVALSFAIAYREAENKQKAEVAQLVEALQVKEIKLTETNNKLEQRVKERTAMIQEKNISLEQQYVELEKLNALKNRFLSIIGHDLKNPIGAILNFSDLLCQNMDVYSLDKIKLFTNQIHKSTAHTYQLLVNLLDWARSQSNAIKYSPEPVSLANLLQETIDVLQHSAQAKQITIHTDFVPIQRIMVDVNMMKTILRNLISNAIKFSHPNSTVNVTISVAAHAVIKISDCGVGMTAEQTKNLFRIDSNSSTLGTNYETGTGLGLIITHEFVQRMNGSIAVNSMPNEGTVFTIILPAGVPNRE